MRPVFALALIAVGLLAAGTTSAQTTAPACPDVALEELPSSRLATWEVDCYYVPPGASSPTIDRCPMLVVHRPSFFQAIDFPGCGQALAGMQQLPIVEERYACDEELGCVQVSSTVTGYVQDWTTVSCP